MDKLKFNTFVALILAFSLLLVGCSSSGGDKPVINSANLNVMTQDAETKTDIQGASVKVTKDFGESQIQSTDQNGEANFSSLSSGTYTVSVVKDQYISTEGEVQLSDSDKTKTINLAKEVVTKRIDTNTTEVGNGVADMDVSDSEVQKALTGKQVSISATEESVVDKAVASGDSNVVGSTEKVVGPTFSFTISDTTNQQGVISANLSSTTTLATSTNPKVNMKLDISNLVDDIENIDPDKYAILAALKTQSGVEFVRPESTIDITDGKINGAIPIKDSNGNLVTVLNLSIVEKEDPNARQETTVQDAKEFVNNLKNHGVNLKEVGQNQANKIETNFNQDVIPYMTAIGYRMERFNEVLNAWELLSDLAYDSNYDNYEYIPGYGPGTYTIDLASLDEFEQMRWSWPGDYPEFSDFSNYRNEFYANTSYDADQYTPGEYAAYEKYYFDNYNFQYNSFIDYVEEQTGFILEKSVISNPKTANDWKWNINFVNSEEEVTIEVANPDVIEHEEVIDSPDYDYYEKETVDLTKAKFIYTHTSRSDSAFNWSFNYRINAEATEVVEGSETYTWTEYDGTIHKERYDYKTTLPTRGAFAIEGFMTDNQTINDTIIVDGVPREIPAIGDVTVDASLNLDTEIDNAISYEGNFRSEELNYNGSASIKFSDIPSYGAINDGTAQTPTIKSLEFNGGLSTNVFKLNGSTGVKFINKEVDSTTVPLPDLITFTGFYEDESVNNGFIYDGSLKIDPTYDNFDMSQIETKNNYLPGVITLEGSLKNTGFEDVNLALELSRDGYEHLNSKFRYEFGGNKFIEGEANVGVNEEFNLTAYNEQDLEIVMKASYSSNQGKVGEIRNYYGTKLYGEIVTDASGQPIVNFNDKTVSSLLPTK